MSDLRAYLAFKSDVLLLEGNKDLEVDNTQSNSQYKRIRLVGVSVVSVGATSDFLLVKPGDIVVVEEGSVVVDDSKSDWWVAQVIHVVGGARDSQANSLFQVACVDSGIIRTINADVVKGVLKTKDLEG